MNRKLTVLAKILKLAAAVLLLFSALRADGGLSFWLTPALLGIVLGGAGLGLSWLCAPEGKAFRRRAFGDPPVPEAPPRPAAVIPFPKAG